MKLGVRGRVLNRSGRRGEKGYDQDALYEILKQLIKMVKKIEREKRRTISWKDLMVHFKTTPGFWVVIDSRPGCCSGHAPRSSLCLL